jgi:hypothetical protein
VVNVLGGGGNSLNSLALSEFRNGFRGFATYWVDDRHYWSLEAGGFVLETSHGSLDAAAVSHPGSVAAAVPPALMLRPVVGGVIDVPNSRGIVDTPISGPDGLVDLDASDVLTSHLRGTSRRQQVWGLEGNVRYNLLLMGGTRFDLLVGGRYLYLNEQLTLQGDYTFMEPPSGGDADETPANPEDNHTNVMHTTDSIAIRNNFYGGQVGLSFESYLTKRLFLNGFAKLALGGTAERINLEGSTLLDATTIETNAGGPFIPRPSTTLPGGLLTPPVPVGITAHRSRFSVMTDLNINVGYQLTSFLRAYAGYNYLRLSNVARVRKQSFLDPTSDQGHLEIQGVDCGVQLIY